MHDTYYLRIWDVGLCKFKEDGTFELVPGGERFANERVYSMLPYDDERILIGTRNEGLFIYDGQTFTPFKTEADPYITGRLYLPGLALEDGRFLLNTFGDGAYLIDHEGKLLQKYTTDNGLEDGSVDNLYLDSRGVLWLTLFNGISSINLNSNFTSLDSNMGLTTAVFSTIRHNGTLYLSLNNGIAYLDEADGQIKKIPGTFEQGGNFLEFRDRLFVTT
ncbi:MAG: hypothetical protein P8Z38_01900, partial [Robiginitalea sp.]